MEALLFSPCCHSFRSRIPGSYWMAVLRDTWKGTPQIINVSPRICKPSDLQASFVFTVKKTLVQNKRKMSNPAAAPSLLWEMQLGCCLILASRTSLCVGAERAVPVLRALLLLLARRLSQKEALHLLTLQQQLDLQLEQISVACSFLWFGLGPPPAVSSSRKTNLLALQEKADVILRPTA